MKKTFVPHEELGFRVFDCLGVLFAVLICKTVWCVICKMVFNWNLPLITFRHIQSVIMIRKMFPSYNEQ